MEKYDVALSFAGEDRHHAERLTELLTARGYSVFYDAYEWAQLWGKDLYVHLSSVYKDQANYCVMFLSEHYAQKTWANHERESAQARAFEENREYILPVRLDDTEIPGVLPTVGYLDLRSMTIEQVYQVLVEKLSGVASQTPTINRSAAAVGESGSDDVVTRQILERTEEGMKRVFISYVNENFLIVDLLYQELDSCGIQVWMDRNNIAPGLRWKQEIRRAIQQGAFFIACFSQEYDERARTYMNEELTIAIEELRQRPTDSAWFIPVKLNECEIPDLDIGRGETLRDLQYVNLYEDWDINIQRILKIVQPAPSDTATNTNTSEERINQSAHAEFSKGLAYQNSVSETNSLEEKKEKHEKALRHYSRALELKPDYVDAYNARGMIFVMWGKIDHALKDFGMAIKLKPDYFVAYLNRGVVHRSDGRYEQALKDFGKVIELQPSVYAGYSNRGEAYRLKGDFDCAIADYNRAIQLKPDYAEAYNDRGIAYANKGEFVRAIVDYTEAIEMKPRLAAAYYNRGVTWLHLREWEKAKADLRNARIMGVNIIAAFLNDYGSVAGFEQITGIQLPADLASMLIPQQ